MLILKQVLTCMFYSSLVTVELLGDCSLTLHFHLAVEYPQNIQVSTHEPCGPPKSVPLPRRGLTSVRKADHFQKPQYG